MSEKLAKIRFITANYSWLQGLRMVPVGIFIGLAGVWVSIPAGQDGDLVPPFFMMVFTVIAYVYIHRYYTRTFGQVDPTGKERNREIFVSILMGILAFFAFLFDSAEILPISVFGLVAAAALAVDLLRTVGKESLINVRESIIIAALIALASLVPLAGFFWWELFGLNSSTAGVMVLMGVLMIVIGIVGHLRFTRLLAEVREAGNV